MKKEEKELLLKDLCCRLPYGVKCSHPYGIGKLKSIAKEEYGIDVTFETPDDNYYPIDDCKPYLLPLSSMTNEQEEELYILLGNESVGFQRYDNAFLDKDGYSEISMISILKGIDWLNANHFDYRGLIPMGLAADATGLNIY